MSDQRKVTAEEFEKMTPRQQGVVSYMQGAWNADVPDGCPYEEGTAEYRAWNDGQTQACLCVQDLDD